MCIQSYYNYNKNNTKLNFDLLSEIRKTGLKKWTQKIKKIRQKIKSDKNYFLVSKSAR